MTSNYERNLLKALDIGNIMAAAMAVTKVEGI